MVGSKPILCCRSAAPYHRPELPKPYNDPNRPVHDAVYRSFINFAVRTHLSIDLLKFLNEGALESTPELPSKTITIPPLQPPAPSPVLTPDALRNNPLTPQTPWAMHIACRYDYGPIYSHRYFACPLDLQDDWTEVSLVQWFAEGEPFKVKAERWDLKCEVDSKFFRLTLRPNLALREHPPSVASTTIRT